MSKYQVFAQTYKENEICDLLKATFYSLDDALAYRDWQTSGNPMLVAYIKEDPDESVLERAKRAYGLAESEEERKRRQKREIMRRYRAKKRAQKGMQEAPGGGAATTLRATPTVNPQEGASVQLHKPASVVSVCAGEDGNVVFYKE